MRKKVSIACVAWAILMANCLRPASADVVWVPIAPYEAVVQANGNGDRGPGQDWKVRFRVPSSTGPWIWNHWKPSFSTTRAAQTFDVSWNTNGYRRWSLNNGWDVMEFTAGLRARGTRYAWWWSPWTWGNEFRIVIPIVYGRV